MTDILFSSATGPFKLSLRLYEPLESVLHGSWKAPEYQGGFIDKNAFEGIADRYIGLFNGENCHESTFEFNESYLRPEFVEYVKDRLAE